MDDEETETDEENLANASGAVARASRRSDSNSGSGSDAGGSTAAGSCHSPSTGCTGPNTVPRVDDATGTCSDDEARSSSTSGAPSPGRSAEDQSRENTGKAIQGPAKKRTKFQEPPGDELDGPPGSGCASLITSSPASSESGCNISSHSEVRPGRVRPFTWGKCLLGENGSDGWTVWNPPLRVLIELFVQGF